MVFAVVGSGVGGALVLGAAMFSRVLVQLLFMDLLLLVEGRCLVLAMEWKAEVGMVPDQVLGDSTSCW